MSDHPSREELQAFLQDSLADARRREVVRHLLRPCARCRAEIESLARRRGVVPESAALTREEDAAYDAAIQRAFRKARAHHREVRRAVTVLSQGGLEAAQKPPLKTSPRARYEALLAHSWTLRYEDTGAMMQHAHLALKCAEGLEASHHGAARVLDYQARAWAELGNAYRLQDQLDLAERALDRARELFELGTRDEELEIRLLELEATLAASRRRFREAIFLLQKAYEFHRQKGNRDGAARAVIKSGLYTGYAGELEEAIRLLKEGLALVHGDGEPSLVYAAVHNQLHFLIDLGRFLEARRFRLENSRLLALGEGRMNRARLRGLEGKLDAGLGNLARAEVVFREVQAEFEELGRPYVASIVALDLSAVLLAQRRTKEAREVALEAYKVFRALRIGREAMAALLALRTAFEMDRATVAMVQDVAAFLRRLEHDPNARFEPRG